MPTSATEHQVIEQTVKMPLDHYQMIVENNVKALAMLGIRKYKSSNKNK